MRNSLLVNSRNLHVVWTGSSNVHFFCFHGFTGNPFDFRILAEQDPHSFYSFHSISCPYHQPCGSDLVDLDEWTDYIASVLLNLKDAKIVFIAYSMGGRYVLRMPASILRSVETVVLVGVTPGLEAKDERIKRIHLDRKWQNILKDKGLSLFLEKWNAQPLIQSQKSIDPRFYSEILSNKLLLNPIGLTLSLKNFGSGAVSAISNLSLSNFVVPNILLFNGNLDSKFSKIMEHMSHNFYNSKRFEISDAGHACHLEKPSEFFKTLVKNLKIAR